MPSLGELRRSVFIKKEFFVFDGRRRWRRLLPAVKRFLRESLPHCHLLLRCMDSVFFASQLEKLCSSRFGCRARRCAGACCRLSDRAGCRKGSRGSQASLAKQQVDAIVANMTEETVAADGEQRQCSRQA